ncbi:MAG: ABC transporter substrate-binding protein [Alphaproteobacteria bacterium]|nr:ABC transporter substrate-binding protein [Alphaproteobacteria bacterium]MDX5370747.1 ABC transporter substrate-binding protein [Alphaproteobacteria bacterium]MDX5465161.1 ABC transporter substrate-binding protein [Alphaproteobacteria bacterium]
MPRRVLTAAVAAAILALGAAQAARAAEPMTVLLDWFVNPDHAPLIVAEQRGYFAEEGLDVTLIEPADPNDPPKLLAAGQGDVAVSYQPQLHIFADRGLPVVRIGTLVATPLTSLVALKDGPVQAVTDLKGKKVGFSVGGFEDAVLGAMLETHGLTLGDVELVNVNFSLSPALLARQVDAVIGAYRNFELNQLEIEGSEGIAFFPEEHGVPPYDELIYLARKGGEDDPRLKAFLRAVQKGVIFTINHPDAAFADFVAWRPSLDDELNRRAWVDTLPRFALRPAALDRGRYDAFHAFLKARGIVTKEVPVDEYAIELR